MSRPCPSCGRLVLGGGAACVHCGGRLTSGARTTTLAAALLGLTVGGCLTKSQPLYGATIADSFPTTDTDTPDDTTDTGAR